MFMRLILFEDLALTLQNVVDENYRIFLRGDNIPSFVKILVP